MQLTKHIDKGFWAMALQALIALYGLAFMLLVVRVLPAKEYGNFVLIQTTFLILGHLGGGFAFGPIVKYLYEFNDRKKLLTNAFFLGVVFYFLFGSLVWLLKTPLGSLFNSNAFPKLAYFVPLLLVVSFGKFFTTQLLRALYRIQGIFWIHLIYHGSALVFILILTFSGKLTSAYQLLMILVVAFIFQSVVGFWLVRDQLGFTWRLDFPCLKTLINYGKYILGASASNQIYDRVDVFMIAAFVGPVEVALYNSAKLFMRIIDLYRQGVALLAMPAFSKLNSEKRDKDIKAVYDKGILFSHILVIPMTLILIIFAKELFHFFYGGRYLDGVLLLQLFAITGPLLVWQCVGEGLLNGLGFPQISFGARTATTITKVFLNLILISLFQSVGAVVASIISMFVLALVITRGVRSKINFSLYDILRRVQDIQNFLKFAR